MPSRGGVPTLSPCRRSPSAAPSRPADATKAPSSEVHSDASGEPTRRHSSALPASMVSVAATNRIGLRRNPIRSRRTMTWKARAGPQAQRAPAHRTSACRQASAAQVAHEDRAAHGAGGDGLIVQGRHSEAAQRMRDRAATPWVCRPAGPAGAGLAEQPSPCHRNPREHAACGTDGQHSQTCQPDEGHRPGQHQPEQGADDDAAEAGQPPPGAQGQRAVERTRDDEVDIAEVRRDRPAYSSEQPGHDGEGPDDADEPGRHRRGRGAIGGRPPGLGVDPSQRLLGEGQAPEQREEDGDVDGIRGVLPRATPPATRKHLADPVHPGCVAHRRCSRRRSHGVTMPPAPGRSRPGRRTGPRHGWR
jgi:hypothetical protein